MLGGSNSLRRSTFRTSGFQKRRSSASRVSTHLFAEAQLGLEVLVLALGERLRLGRGRDVHPVADETLGTAARRRFGLSPGLGNE
jgi:hypothetical protein